MTGTLVEEVPTGEDRIVDVLTRAEAYEAKSRKKAIDNHDLKEWEMNEVVFWYIAVKKRHFPILQVPEQYLYKVAHILFYEEQEEERATFTALTTDANPS